MPTHPLLIAVVLVALISPGCASSAAAGLYFQYYGSLYHMPADMAGSNWTTAQRTTVKTEFEAGTGDNGGKVKSRIASYPLAIRPATPRPLRLRPRRLRTHTHFTPIHTLNAHNPPLNLATQNFALHH
jgi:hypothetical protein